MARLFNGSIILALISVLLSCRFHKPLVKFQDRSFEKKDTLNNTTLKIESYKYPRISWWLRRPHWTGAYILNSQFDQNGKLTEKIFSWYSNTSLSDGNLKIKTKIVYYSDSLKIIKIDYMIDKFQGRGRMPVFRKTVVWDKKEEKYKKIQN
jgi:hypothetical protein